ncbi:Glycosyltransferase involved in cell wall bisynthesis [Lampropedia hyalina DSM 16112]|jgi:glycosyltransferase involved in cell wall biosynthesis|uniref:Glycosyltransferase involved in cell wall bisynthesis n=1 Tax=Lampropedia hyalina DSM 16112 TaxID=1122156 RepID=A0A1M5AQP7_9BURK|nr:glycosyltransferase [Lampropedia hyalina]SHF32559.1 Glycosyltransferase involved in cell wall bisynthesis [Lampropedia hyalina DSM 16112]
MKKVIHIITGLNDGGAEAVLYRLVTSDRENVHHIVSMMNNGKYGPLLRNAGVQVTCLNMPQGKVTLLGLWKLWRLLHKERPAVVQTWMYHANLIGGVVACLAGVKKIFWGIHHTTLAPESTKRSTIFVAKVCARISRLVPTAIVCCAQKSVEVHQALGYAEEKMYAIPNGYDLSRFSWNFQTRRHLREQWGISENQWLLGMVGRFDPLKDHGNLLHALAEIKKQGIEFFAVLVGRGMDSSNDQLKKWMIDLNLVDEVRLLGQRTDVPDVMNALDVHVLSSCSEAFPNVLAEAMACGTPVVTTDVGDAAVIVGDTGWVVPPKDATALAHALLQARRAMDDAEGWQLRRTAARQRVEENFSLSRMLESYNTLWRDGKL